MRVREWYGEGEIIAPPAVEVTPWPALGFVTCPLALQGAFLYDFRVQEIYRIAYERARAASRPTWCEQLYRAPQN